MPARRVVAEEEASCFHVKCNSLLSAAGTLELPEFLDYGNYDSPRAGAVYCRNNEAFSSKVEKAFPTLLFLVSGCKWLQSCWMISSSIGAHALQ